MKGKMKMRELTDKEYDALAARLSGEQSATDHPILDNEEEKLLMEAWNETGMMKKGKIIDVDKAWTSVHSQIELGGIQKERHFVLRMISRIPAGIAATITLLIMSGLFALFLLPKNGSEIVIAGSDSVREVTLPDGSSVTLNRNSTLEWEDKDWGKARNVKLTGEGFFNVARDETSPFTVDAGAGSVRVLGTSFNVRAYKYADEVEVVVETGKVLLSNKTRTSSLTINPGSKGLLKDDNASLEEKIDPNYMAWRTRVLTYEGTPLSVVFADMKRVYGIDVTTTQNEIYDMRLTTIFDNISHDTIVEVLSRTFNLSFARDGKGYMVSIN